MNEHRSAAANRSSKTNEAQLVIIYWRDIPAQVNAQAGRTRAQAPLSPRFQRAIDRAAMVAGLTNSHDYVTRWRRVARQCLGDLETSAQSESERLEALYDDVRLRALAEAGGIESAVVGSDDPPAGDAR